MRNTTVGHAGAAAGLCCRASRRAYSFAHVETHVFALHRESIARPPNGAADPPYVPEVAAWFRGGQPPFQASLVH